MEPLEQFLAHLRHERRLSENTCRAYRSDLVGMFSAFSEFGFSGRPEELGISALRRWLSEVYEGLSAASRRRKLSALRSFYAYLVRVDQAAVNVGAQVPLPRAPRPLPRALTVDETFALLEHQGPSPEDLFVLRDSAMLELLYGSGLRVSELVGMDLEDLDLGRRRVRVLGKGRKTRCVGESARNGAS